MAETTLGPSPLIPADCTIDRPIPQEVWALVRELHRSQPNNPWHLLAVDRDGRKHLASRAFPAGQRRFATLWAAEWFYKDAQIMALKL